jgi:hypothetical protein
MNAMPLPSGPNPKPAQMQRHLRAANVAAQVQAEIAAWHARFWKSRQRR